MSAEAAITAIICMQPYVHDTRDYALNRIAGTLIGAAWGFLFLLVVPLFPAVTGIPLYALMGLGILISLYSAVVIRETACAASSGPRRGFPAAAAYISTPVKPMCSAPKSG